MIENVMDISIMKGEKVIIDEETAENARLIYKFVSFWDGAIEKLWRSYVIRNGKKGNQRKSKNIVPRKW